MKKINPLDFRQVTDLIQKSSPTTQESEDVLECDYIGCTRTDTHFSQMCDEDGEDIGGYMYCPLHHPARK
jgi:hypothetical protein